jgi:AraC family transcriptional regulator
MLLKLMLPQVEIHHITSQFENESHAHDDSYQMTIPTHGNCYFTHEEKQCTLAVGDALLLRPNDRHCFHMGEDAGVIIAIVKNQALEAEHSSMEVESSLFKEIKPEQVRALLREWVQTALEHSAGEGLALQEAGQRIVADLHHLLREPGRIAPLRPDISARDPYLRLALEYIHSCYTEQMTVEELAAIARQSRFHFIRSFKAAVGFTPYQYVLHLRIEDAKRRLRETACTVTDISFQLGFASPSQFYRSFEKTVGTTPERYRSHV